MPTFWLSALLKSLICKPTSSDSVDSMVSRRVNSVKMRKPIPEAERSASFGCLSNLKDVIPGSKIHKGKRPSSSGSKINGSSTSSAKESSGRKVKGLLEHEGHNLEPRYELQRSISDPSRKFHDGSVQRSSFSDQHSRKDHEGPILVCQICEGQHNHSNAAESPCLPKHSVSELAEGDASRKIVEIICQSEPESNINKSTKIDRILKVHNTENILYQFEDYREMVKNKASRESKKVDPRCSADGNELLRFYATTISCSLGTNDSSSPCKSNTCGACQILRNGFSARKDFVGRFGISAASTSERALKHVGEEGHDHFKRKALFVCRVIAGQIHSPVRKFDQGYSFSSSGFDSWKLSRNNSAEELLLLNPSALLPCFVVIYNI